MTICSDFPSDAFSKYFTACFTHILSLASVPEFAEASDISNVKTELQAA